LLAALTLGAGEVPALTEALAGAERALADVEATLTPEQQAALAATREVRAFTAEETRRRLPAGACLLEYQMVGRDYIMYAVTTAEIVAQEGQLDRGTFDGMTSRFVRASAIGAPSPEAEELAAVLLAPFSTILARHERVIVVPSGALNAVPFHVLPFAGKPLGETHVVSYLPAASMLAQGAVDRPLAAGATLVVGDPAFDPATHPLLHRLAGAAVEAKAVAAVHGAEAYVGALATEAALRPLLRDRALLHFAAHGRLDEIAPNTSSIVLAGDDELTVSDLIGLDIGADLAVLSACDTGRGTTTMGGDLIGLVRGLLASGVSRCVVSLWPVDDVAACVTMAAFHHRLKQGTAPAVALAQAQREIRTLSGADIADRYRAMGGALAAGDRALRRKGKSSVRLSAFPEVDTEEDIPVGAEDGQRTSIWAPFVLIGV
jgi:CHAT domain-containing protein